MKYKSICYLLLAIPTYGSAQQLNYPEKAKKLVSQMTLEEKTLLLSGDGWWKTYAVKRLGIPSIFLTDGPNGLRKAEDGGLGQAVPATCFPTASALSSSWNVNLIGRVGVALAQESQANDVQILLGPGINMKRSPLGGRNFEYFSEDPILAGKLAASYIRAVQSEGVGTSLKHFAVNNQEFERMASSSNVDERTLHEIYLTAFEIAVKEGKPWTVMASYNKVNGVYSSENPLLLRDILRKNWGFKGFVVSDWGAVNNRVNGLNAGLNLEMPGSGVINQNQLIQAVKDGKLPVATLDESVTELLAVILKAKDSHKAGAKFDAEQHNTLAREAGAESIVLLKNEDHILPLQVKKQKIAFIGGFAKNPRYQGAGSSQVNPIKISNTYAEMQKYAGSKEISYAEGYQNQDKTTDELIAEAVKTAKDADVAVVFVGLPDSYESEGFDRASMDMPEAHNKLIEAVAAVQKNTIVVLMNGSSVTMPWLPKVKAVVEGWLTGQASGGAMADVLSGKVNPSGKLSETFAGSIHDTPTALEFPGLNQQANYGEGVYIGYRYYDKKQIEPLFPFGYGLSYTSFSYSDLELSADQIKDTDSLTVKLKVKNTGKVAGKEIVQLYVGNTDATVSRPVKELKAFTKLALEPGEEKTAEFKLSKRDFAYYNVRLHDWAVNPGVFHILAGGSSAGLPLDKMVTVSLSKPVVLPITRNSMVKEFLAHPGGEKFYPQLLKGFGVDVNQAPPKNMTTEQTEAKKKSDLMMMSFLSDLPAYKLVYFSGGHFSFETLDEIVKQINQQ
ncbi:glycoside hydrolase family 3 C-terminal domain-containing protein [Pedobacter sp. L105]|uniref:glycoside hydrolase family 3 C-terminal domain-containing protein n=1 Tax=Pedobacter sp. L105 TaxID=1641871 RepID=UPI001C205CA1|nr:glycoside hydrolase family 3 C-terminal domain-containing protein [Pedobacter sp. L105]